MQNLASGVKIKHVGRLAQITKVLARHGFWSVLESSGIRAWLSREQVTEAEQASSTGTEETFPRRLREALEELGPAFVKLGQLLASREDILSEQLLKELRKLHQDVQTIPFQQIQKVIEHELGPNIAEFSEITATPLAAGSIGQVHVATLKNGTRVALKVQRPAIADSMHVDLDLMFNLALLLEKYLQNFQHLRPATIVEEFARGLETEVDYVREAANTTKLAENFRDNPSVVIPKVYWSLSTSKVLTVELINGYSFTEKESLEKAGFDLSQLAERGAEMFLQMVFVDGFYHGDLHAGNLMALEGNRVAVLDCGLTVRLSRVNREALAALLIAIVREDYEMLAAHFVELADVGGKVDLSAFEDAIASELAPFMGSRLRKSMVGKLLWRLARTSAELGAPMPKSLVLFFRTLASFEGIGIKLNPDFDVLGICEKFSQNLVSKMYGPETLKKQALIVARDLSVLGRQAPRQVRALLRQISDGEIKVQVVHPEINSAVHTIDRMISRLAISLILASLIVGSSILVLARAGGEYQHISSLGVYGFTGAGILSVYVMWSMFRSR